MQNEKQDLVNCQKEYDYLYSQKKSELIRENGEVAHKILELSDGISKSKNNIIEIDEAITAGNKVLESIHITLKSFKSAQNLGHGICLEEAF